MLKALLLSSLLVIPAAVAAQQDPDAYEWRIRQELAVDSRPLGSTNDDWEFTGQQLGFTSFPTTLELALEQWYLKVCVITGGENCVSGDRSQIKTWAEGLIEEKRPGRRD